MWRRSNAFVFARLLKKAKLKMAKDQVLLRGKQVQTFEDVTEAEWVSMLNEASIEAQPL